jgi:aminoglycoside N3'-acetyltransferase
MKRTALNIDSLFHQLLKLGIKTGDVIFIAADLMKLGYFNKNRKQTLDDIVSVLISLIGPNGTIVIPSYTDYFIKFNKRSEIIFNQYVSSTSGSLSNHLLNYPGVFRSTHPTNSLLAIGKDAEYILSGHNENSLSYSPYFKIIELGGKNLMLACFDDFQLAPMALHAAQEKLGYTSKNWLSGLIQTYYYNNQGEKLIFTRYDVGGCVAGGHKAIAYHFVKDAIKISQTGNSLSALIDTRKSYDIFIDLLKNKPEFIRCDNLFCHDCYGSRIYNPKMYVLHWIQFVIRKIFIFIKNNIRFFKHTSRISNQK